MSEKRTEISEIGEFGLIDKIKETARVKSPNVVKSIGDDAAVSRSVEGQLHLLSSDMLLEGVHFDLSYAPLHHLGYKAIAVNVSDIAAMNGTPKQVLVNVGLSNRFSVEALEALYEGINAACESYNIDLVGGDTTSSASGLVISVTIFGSVSEDRVSYRSGAEPKQILCATGDLGAALIGLQILEREKEVFLTDPEMKPKLEQYKYVVQRQLKPEARMDIVHELADAKVVPSAMIDISDGLASEIFHLCQQSEVGVRIYEDKLPIDKQTYDTAVEFKLDPITCVLNGGEDYELLFTIKQSDFEKLEKHPDIHFIGEVLPKGSGASIVTKGGNEVQLEAQGWKHFES